MANHTSRGQQRDKPFRDALRKRIAEAAEDPKKLDRIAAKLLDLAEAGDVQAIREVGDRLDGKVAQAVIGGEDDDPAINTITRIEIVGVRPADQGS